jgi:hypothetical protein
MASHRSERIWLLVSGLVSAGEEVAGALVVEDGSVEVQGVEGGAPAVADQRANGDRTLFPVRAK